MTAPDRIWTSKCGRALVTIHPRWADDVEYIRADLATPAALSPEVRALVDAAQEFDDALDTPGKDCGAPRLRMSKALAALLGIGDGRT